MAPHKIFLIPEILEHILLQTPPQTLLTTAQRTSQTWHHVITTSPRLQETLFFKPQPQPPNPRTKTTNRTLNPLLPHKIWPHLFRKRLTSQTTTTTNYGYTLPAADPVEEELYLRPNASWRRMLVQQPPTSSISVFVMHRSWISCDEDISPVKVFTADVEFLTLGRLHWSAFVGCLLPLERVACFWNFGDYYQVKDVEWRREMELAMERFGDACDLVYKDKVPDLTEPTNPWPRSQQRSAEDGGRSTDGKGLAALFRRDRRSKNNKEALRVNTPHHPPGKLATYRHVSLEVCISPSCRGPFSGLGLIPAATSSYRSLSPKTRALFGVGVMAWASIGLWVLPEVEGAMGMAPTKQEQEELDRKMAIRISRVDKDGH
ncbi:hypothetical protein P875_00042448 [Aspergillus parasiticus SU-1]|uniref:F-box domain-containing protein n=1 Tax=Aspergillus parasiticus (strain ATCC 56775 / NRRL 5862 / SRRC 143 / SU-1) TaxID=1403190 RepID=A0A0F0I5P9_ASPPU|nr:hypothetical protein P875_00042448 [Aspergillus parasiticus SU-1]